MAGKGRVRERRLGAWVARTGELLAARGSRGPSSPGEGPCWTRSSPHRGARALALAADAADEAAVGEAVEAGRRLGALDAVVDERGSAVGRLEHFAYADGAAWTT
jgi:hypothetical protein